MKRYKLAKSEIKKATNTQPDTGESITEKSRFRPEVATLRDKAVKLIEAGAGRKGLFDSDLQIDEKTEKALAYARRPDRDIVEIESARRAVEASINVSKEMDKENIKKIKKDAQNESMSESLKTIAKNTTKTTEKQTIQN